MAEVAVSEGLFRRATELAFSWVKDLARGNFHKKRGKKIFVAGVARTEIENESKRRGRTPALANLGAEREATQSKSTSSLILATMQKVAGWHALISRWGNAFKARLSLSTWWCVINSLALFITNSDWQPTDPAPRITWKLFLKIRLKQ